ncbi:MAG: hypothetical protein RIR62_538 [Pseudomonadota bacterium]
MKNELLTVAEAALRIEAGDILSIAGPDHLLAQLPAGHWIGGTTVYLLTDAGGARVEDRVFCTTFPMADGATLRHLPVADLPAIAEGYLAGGATLILLPGFSQAHSAFALEGAGYPGLFDQPLMGWVTGVPVEEIGTATPAVYDGRGATRHTEGAMVMHLSLPEGAQATLDIVNIFEQGRNAATVTFAQTGFAATRARVDGVEVDFATWLRDAAIDTRLPLVANYAGAMVNVSIRTTDAEKGEVTFYAPVVAGVEYRLATPVADYATAFRACLADGGASQHSCNCILNYLYGDMAGKKTGQFTGPVTFGEIAYILLNQTLVKLDIAA